ncbi:MAG: AAA family ATPase [Elusimicrobiota bacterium]|jgi:ATP-dependent exoDNAse (exonuclease V) alpha subunit|nr:AAA family ATPase [Elusimicrobiota bacterium]
MSIEINNEFKEALALISQTDDCVFVTGNAGTGKTTFLHHYITRAQKKTVVLAPTGVAALNAGGETIHSFFKFKPDITISKIKKKKLKDDSIYKKVETIIIDEASMLRCDLLDCIDRFLRINRDAYKSPFGGVQIVFIGDLEQLPPVVKREEEHIFNSYYQSPYFLSAFALRDCLFHTVELKKIYRQQDQNFISLLNRIRNANADDDDLRLLNKKVSKNLLSQESFLKTHSIALHHCGLDPQSPPANEIAGLTRDGGKNCPQDMPIYLTTTNKKASWINQQYLSKIKEPTFEFLAKSDGIDETRRDMPAEFQLIIKKGAQVMMLNNDKGNRWVNGSIGIVESIEKAGDNAFIRVKFANERVETVSPYEWELFKYKWNVQLQQIETEKAGSFTQYPLKLSWAVTIHKSQGKTFNNIIVDMEYGAFAPGQLYVALSRCRALEGISLARALTRRDIIKANY